MGDTIKNEIDLGFHLETLSLIHVLKLHFKEFMKTVALFSYPGFILRYEQILRTLRSTLTLTIASFEGSTIASSQ